MGGINPLGGLDKFSVDYRPPTGPAASATKSSSSFPVTSSFALPSWVYDTMQSIVNRFCD